MNSFTLLQMDRLQLTAVFCNRRCVCVTTAPQMTYFLGANVCKITTSKSYDEMSKHDNKMRI